LVVNRIRESHFAGSGIDAAVAVSDHRRDDHRLPRISGRRQRRLLLISTSQRLRGRPVDRASFRIRLVFHRALIRRTASPEMLVATTISAFGRTGTTALMAWLATDRRVALDRQYPFENRYLTWLAKIAVVARRSASPALDALQLEAWHEDRLGPPPWAAGDADDHAPLMPAEDDWLRALWATFSGAVRARTPGAALYAEKTPCWVAPVVRDVIPTRTIHLVRDPRDVFLSAAGFVRRTGAIGFGTEGGLAQARHIAYRMLAFHENARADAARAGTIRLRYEDMLASPRRVADTLRDALGLEVASSLPRLGADDARHRTSPTPAESIARWRTQPLAGDVREYLEGQLYELMVENGYELADGSPPARQLSIGPEMPRSPDGTIAASADGLLAVVTGGDFWIEVHVDPDQTAHATELWACVRGGTGDHCSVYWRGPHGSYSEQRVVHVPFRPGPQWQIVRVPLAAHPEWRGPLQKLRIDLFNGRATAGSTGEVRWLRLVD
jgi:hypothetical protein